MRACAVMADAEDGVAAVSALAGAPTRFAGKHGIQPGLSPQRRTLVAEGVAGMRFAWENPQRFCHTSLIERHKIVSDRPVTAEAVNTLLTHN